MIGINSYTYITLKSFKFDISLGVLKHWFITTSHPGFSSYCAYMKLAVDFIGITYCLLELRCDISVSRSAANINLRFITDALIITIMSLYDLESR